MHGRVRMLFLVLALALASFLAVPTARACPLCKEAIAVADTEEEVNNWPKAMNQSIYLMLAVPYSALVILGFLIYRGLRQNEAYLAKLRVAESDSVPPPQPAP